MKQAHQIITPSNALKLKLGQGIGGIDVVALASAEAAVKQLAGKFDQWMQDEFEKLDAVRARMAAEGYMPIQPRASIFAPTI